jgi:hypothetical protein
MNPTIPSAPPSYDGHSGHDGHGGHGGHPSYKRNGVYTGYTQNEINGHDYIPKTAIDNPHFHNIRKVSVCSNLEHRNNSLRIPRNNNHSYINYKQNFIDNSDNIDNTNTNSIDNLNYSPEVKLDLVIKKYNIHHLFSEHMSVLKNYKLVLCVDDSSSMNNAIIESNNGCVLSRYEEIKTIIDMLINITKIYDNDGLDVHFLNKNPVYNITDYGSVKHILDKIPSGHTPLRHITKGIFHHYKYIDKPLLLIVVTDGLPTDNNGNENLEAYINLLKKRNCDTNFISFLSCSEIEEDVHYLKKLSKNIENVSFLNTYNKENKIITSIKGASYRYTRGDHLARLLLTPIIEKIDIVDELRLYKYDDTNQNKHLKRHRNKRKRVKKKKECIIL